MMLNPCSSKRSPGVNPGTAGREFLIRQPNRWSARDVQGADYCFSQEWHVKNRADIRKKTGNRLIAGEIGVIEQVVFMEQLSEKVLAGDRRSIARAITLVENRDPSRFKLLAELRASCAKGWVIGITGSPGSGKSSLVDQMTRQYRKQGLEVGIIAVDPSSPFTGGALLGDRIRMQQHATDHGVFIRSMGTRGNLGGLALATREAIQILSASGKDLVLVETVGVGQSELEIMKIADATVVVLTPGTGDSIQTIKAGIMEIADVFAINKADLPGARRLAREVQAMLETTCHNAAWRPPVIETVTINGNGIKELTEAIENYCQYLLKSGELDAKRRQRAGDEVGEVCVMLLREWFSRQAQKDGPVRKVIAGVKEGSIDPYYAASAVLQQLCGDRCEDWKLPDG